MACELNIEDRKKLNEVKYSDMVDAFMGAKMDVLHMLNMGKPRYGAAPVMITDISWNGDDYNVSYQYGGKGKVYTANAGTYGGMFSFDKIDFNMTTEGLKEFYSDREFLREEVDGFEKTIVGNLNDPEKMVGLLDELAEIEKVSYEERAVAVDGLRVVVDGLKQAIPQMNVWVNKKARENGGWIQTAGEHAGVFVQVGMKKGKSAAEIFAHEIVHAATVFGLYSGAAGISTVRRRLMKLKHDFLKSTTAEMLVDPKTVDKEQALKDAQEMLDYFRSDKGDAEFIAHGLTNVQVRKRLEQMKTREVKDEYPNMAAKLIGLFQEMYEKVLTFLRKEPENMSGYDLLVRMTSQLADVNNRALLVKKRSVMERVFAPLLNVEKALVEKIEEQKEKITRAPEIRLDPNANPAVKAYTLAKILARATVDDNTRAAVSTAMSFFPWLKPEGTVQTTLGNMNESDSAEDVAEQLGMMSNQIDFKREMIEQQMMRTMLEAFKEKPTKEEMEVITSVVMDVDYTAVKDMISIDEIDNDDVINSKIEEIEKKIDSSYDSKFVNYYKTQADGLGWFMATGKANEGQLLNAFNIAFMMNSRYRLESTSDVNSELVKDIDELASLYGLKYTSIDERIAMKELAKREPEAVDMIVKMHDVYKKESERSLFGDSGLEKIKLIKGYSKELFDTDIDVKVALVSQEKEMGRKGYKLAKVMVKDKRDTSRGGERAFYVSTVRVVPALKRQALRYTDKHRRGTSLTEGRFAGEEEYARNYARLDTARIKKDTMVMVDSMIDGTYDRSNKPEKAFLPVYNQLGRIVDYRYMMTKEDKKKYLGQDRRSIHVLGNMYASMYDKSMTEKHNDEVLKVIIEDHERNKIANTMIGKNARIYVRVGKNSPEAHIRDIWSVLPDKIKLQFPDGIVVRRDLMQMFFGYREATIAELPGIRNMSESKKHIIRVAERVWRDVVRLYKIDILIKTPAVIVGNIVSNFMWSIWLGHAPWKVARYQLDGVKNLNEYLEKTKLIMRTEAKIKAGLGSDEDVKNVEMWKGELKTNPVSDLMTAGFYMTIVEELGLDEFKETNKVSKFIEDKIEKLPKIIRQGGDWLYLSHRTEYYKLINTATQYSDFVARYAQYHLMLENGEKKEVAQKTVRDMYINYGKPDSKVLEWMNQMGLVMFTKYFTRIQKALKEAGKGHPLKLALALIGQEIVVDVDDVTDQSIFVADPTKVFYSPWDVVTNVVTPGSYEVMSDVYKHFR